jgi:hypothetical protein
MSVSWNEVKFAGGLRGSSFFVLFGLLGCSGEDESEPPPQPSQPVGCAPGEATRADGSCRPAGILPEECAEGFVHQGDECIAPAPACGPGQMALVDEAACREVAPCPEGTWGDIPVDNATVFVDASFQGTSTGTSSAPYALIQDAVDAAAPGAIVAIAEGAYLESITLFEPVRLWGRCPALVSIVGQSTMALRVNAAAAGSEVRDLAITGAGVGLVAAGADGVVADRLWVHDTSAPGIDVEETGTPVVLTVTRSLIERTAIAGAAALGGRLVFERGVVRDLISASGAGIYAHTGNFSQAPGAIEVRGALVERVKGYGVYVDASSAIIEGSLVRDIFPQSSDGLFGRGVDAENGADVSVRASRIERTADELVFLNGSHAAIETTVVAEVIDSTSSSVAGRGVNVQAQPETGARGSVSLRASVVHHSREFGVFLGASDGDMESTVVRDVLPRSDGLFGRGIAVQAEEASPGTPTFSVRDSVVEHCHEVAIMASGAELVIDHSAVRDIWPAPANQRLGRGIAVQFDPDSMGPSHVEVVRSIVERTIEGGIYVAGSSVKVMDSEVKDTAPEAVQGIYGDGIAVLSYLLPASAEVQNALIAGNARAGISAFGATVSVGGTTLECNAIALDGEIFEMREFSFNNSGGNRCGCGDARAECQVLSSNLTPPDAL